MEILRTIALVAEDKQMPFLLIGGHAVNAYGLSRQTGDIDLLGRRSQRQMWLSLFERLHYSPQQNDDRFCRFRPESILTWPVDLMFVDDETFAKLNSDSAEILVGVANVRVVSARHLAILKIHALKYFQEDRYSKDLSDLRYLLRSGGTGITVEELRDICLKYADLQLFETIKGECS